MMTKSGKEARLLLRGLRKGISDIFYPHAKDAQNIWNHAHRAGRGFYSYGLRPIGKFTVNSANALGKGLERTSDFAVRHPKILRASLIPGALAATRISDSIESSTSYINPMDQTYVSKPGIFFNSLERNML